MLFQSTTNSIVFVEFWIYRRTFLFSADNGLNPVWNDSCEFDVKNPELALLRFVVQDEDMFGDSNFIGQGTYPVCTHQTFWFYVQTFLIIYMSVITV